MRITYIGHATLLIEVAGARVLTDPNFDPKLGRFLRRVAAPGMALDKLPALDAVLVTHAHADHLSFTTLDALPSGVPVFAPPPVRDWLRKLGYRQTEGLGPGETVAVGTGGQLRVHAGAATHVGSRYYFDRWRSAANMYLLDTGKLTCFFAGDTALTASTHGLVHDTLGDRQLDVALLPIGYAPWWKPRYRSGHMSTDDALLLFERLKARILIPYHWGTFHHLTQGPFQAITRLRASLVDHPRQRDVRIIEPGTVFELETPVDTPLDAPADGAVAVPAVPAEDWSDERAAPRAPDAAAPSPAEPRSGEVQPG